MNLREFRRILLSTFVLPIGALLVVSVVLFLQIRSANRAVVLFQQVDRNLTRIGQVQRLIIDQETSVRGFQITQDEVFLDPYRAAEKQILSRLDELEVTTQINPPQVIRTKNLRISYLKWKSGFAEKQIAAVRARHMDDSVEENLRGKALMDDIRHRIAEMFDAGGIKRDQSIAVWQEQVRLTRIYLFSLAAIVGVMIALFMRRQLNKVSASFQQSLAAVQERATALFESEQQLRTTLNSIGDGVIVTDRDGLVELLNPIASDLTGWPTEEARGRPIEEVFNIVNETTRAIVENPVAKVKRENRVVGLANHTVLIRRDGSEINIDDSGAPIRDRNESLVGVVMVFRDVTLEKKTQSALMANERLAVAGRLAATIAHEIHNPLDSVSNVLYLLRTGPHSEEERESLLLLADQELARVTQISRAMLSLYRESRSPIPVELRDLLLSLLTLMEHSIQRSRVVLTQELSSPVTIEGFPAELRQVFTNLITNAYEAAGKDGRLSINLDATPFGAKVEIVNSGPAVDPEVREKLFQPFFSTKGEKGTGLGLWVSRGIVTKHGGTISLESPVFPDGSGTRVSVTLPTKFTTSAEAHH